MRGKFSNNSSSNTDLSEDLTELRKRLIHSFLFLFAFPLLLCFNANMSKEAR